MPKALRRFALPVLALVALAGGASAVAAPADPADPVPAAVRPAEVEPVSEGDRAVFVPVTQKRLLKTTTPIPALGTKNVKVAGVAGVPLDALAVVVNVAAVKPAKAGFLNAYPAGTPRPAGIGVVTYIVGQTAENVATVRVGTGGNITLFASTATNAIVDVAGYYRSHAHDDRYLPKSAAQGRSAANAFLCPDGSLIKSVAADGAPVCVQDATGIVQSVGAGLLLDNAGLLSAQQGRSATDAFTCPVGQYLRAVAADGTPTCAADVDTDTVGPVEQVGLGLLLQNGVLSAEQRRSAANAFTCAPGNYLRAVAADGTPTCAADVDTDTDTTYEFGDGLVYDGVTVTAEQGRRVKNAFTCAPGYYLRQVDADGTPTCDQDLDTDTTYTAGFGLLLSNGVFSAQQGRSAASAFTCSIGQFLRAVAIDGAPTCALDSNTTYAAGFGLSLTNGTFAAQQGRSAANAFTCATGEYLRSVAADGTPTCAADADTKYLAGFGLNLTGNTLTAQQARTALSAFNCPPGQALRIVANDGAPTCIGIPVYTGGHGITVNGGVVSLAQGTTVVPIAGDKTPAENGTALRSALDAIVGATAQKPYVLSLAPGTYDLGGTPLNMKASVSVIGAARNATVISGNLPSQSSGLVNLANNTTLARLTVRNTTSTTNNWAMGIMANSSMVARVDDVSSTAEGSVENYGLLVFNSANVHTNDSQFIGRSTTPGTLGVGIYAILSSFVRANGVEAVSSAPAGYALHSYNGATIEFTHGFANGNVANGGSPLGVTKVAHSRLDGSTFNGVKCFSVHDTAWNAVTCA
jgi:hypothetical protein